MASCSETLELASPDRKTIQSFFNQIARPYDFLNSFLSLGLDHHWRSELVQHSLSGREHSMLDLGVGTGKSLAAFCRVHHFDRAVGCDFSERMLQTAKGRFNNSVSLIAGDVHELPFGSGMFDLVTGSFMLRSVQNLSLFFSEVKRVLRPDGKATFLDLTRPTNFFFRRFCFEPYLKFYVPWMGRLFSKHSEAYRFLSASVQSFIEPSDLKKEFESAGFAQIFISRLNFGIATIIQGVN